MKVKWNKKQLDKIKKTIKPFELNLTKNNSITTYFKPKNKARAYMLYEEFNKLLQLDNEEILRILTLISPIKEAYKKDRNNPLYKSELIKTLGEIDQDDPTEIFCVFKAIIEQYETIIQKTIDNLYKKGLTHEEINEKIKKMIHDDQESEEMKIIKSQINEILNTINQITERYSGKPIFNEPILKSLIKKCNNIKSSIQLDVIWTDKELDKLKPFLKKRYNLEITENIELCQSKTIINSANLPSYSYTIFEKELTDLFFTSDRNKISEILTKASQVQADKNNELHHGLIITLSQINPENLDQIFIIFQEIIGLYYHSIDRFVDELTKEFFIPNKITSKIEIKNKLQEKIDELINSNDPTTEEELIKMHIKNKVFVYSNGVTSSELFSPLINKLDSIIKSVLLKRIGEKIRLIEKELNAPYESHKAKFCIDYNSGLLNKREHDRNKNKKGIK